VWCAIWRPNGRTTLLARTYGPTSLAQCCGVSGAAQFLDRVRVAGRYAAFIYRAANPKSFDGVDSIGEIDVRSGRAVVDASGDASLYTDEDWSSPVNGPEAFGGILDLAINPRGDIAWVVGYQTSSAVYEHGLHRHTRRLDVAAGGAINGLAISLGAVNWTNQGTQQTTRI
jgi:hypothetical protein